MLRMILQMTGTTALYVLATVALWRFWHRKKDHTTAQKLFIGLFYGLCSIASNHLGIVYQDMVLNVRDLGPLAAGLFFGPLAGIVSGLIGGAERFIIGEYFGIGAFTRIACSLSTVFAGLLAAGLNKWYYRGKRPSAIHCFSLGAEMEVFHMYAVFITHQGQTAMALEVVKTCAVPMIAFTAAGLAACSLIIARLSGEAWFGSISETKKETPIDIRFQRWLLTVVAALFAISFTMNYSVQTRVANENAKEEMQFQQYQYQLTYQDNGDLKTLKKELDDNNFRSDTVYLLVDAGQMLQYTMIGSPEGSKPADPEQAALIAGHADGEPFQAAIKQIGGAECFCVAGRLEGDLYLLIGTPTDTLYRNRQSQMLETLFLEILIFTALYLLVSVLVNRLVVRNLERVNKSLALITAGHLNEVVAVEESSEFTKLSGDINTTVTALRGFIDAAEKRMQEDLELAAQIQDSALPKNFQLLSENVELYALMDPAKQVGGDFYDFFYIGPEQVALVIADVSGKGIPAAMFMMRSKTAIKNFARSGMSPAKILEAVNNTLCEGNDAKMFVTVWLGILEVKTGHMRCANAGHEYPALMRAGGQYELLKDRHGFVLGGMEDIPMREYEIQMEPGDRLYVYTDGVAEAINGQEEQYGTARMTAQLNRLRNAPQEAALKGMREDIRQFAGEAEQFDDITMLGITYRQPE